MKRSLLFVAAMAMTALAPVAAMASNTNAVQAAVVASVTQFDSTTTADSAYAQKAATDAQSTVPTWTDDQPAVLTHAIAYRAVDNYDYVAPSSQSTA